MNACIAATTQRHVRPSYRVVPGWHGACLAKTLRLRRSRDRGSREEGEESRARVGFATSLSVLAHDGQRRRRTLLKRRMSMKTSSFDMPLIREGGRTVSVLQPKSFTAGSSSSEAVFAARGGRACSRATRSTGFLTSSGAVTSSGAAGRGFMTTSGGGGGGASERAAV